MITNVTGQYSPQHGFQFSDSILTDFIIQSNKNFYYLNDSKDLIDSKNLATVFVNVIKKNLNKWPQISNQERGQIGKIPYLYQSFLKENSLRFPIIYNNQKLICGYGRAMIANRYFPEMKIPGIIISDKKLPLPYYKIKDVNDIMSIIIKYNYWKDKDLTNIIFGFAVDNNSIIHATDYQYKDEHFVYKFIEDSGKFDDRWKKIISVIDSYSNIDNQAILKIFDQLIKI